jgi:hypothetical protein
MLNIARTTSRATLALPLVAASLSVGITSEAASGSAFNTVPPTSYGWSRTDANSTYYEWDEFGSPFFSSSNFPDVGQFPFPLPASWPDVRAGEITNSAILAASGNLYSLNGQAYFRFDLPTVPAADVVNPVEREPIALDLPAGSLYTTVIIQVRTLGFEIERGTNVVTDTITQTLPITSSNPIENNWPVAGELPVEDTEFFRLEQPDIQFFGDIVDTRFVYEIAGAPGQLFWLATGPQHTSIDLLLIDTHVAQVPEATVCEGDTDGDGLVGTTDLLNLLANWGSTNATGPEQGDFDASGSVGTADLLVLLANWGVTCS